MAYTPATGSGLEAVAGIPAPVNSSYCLPDVLHFEIVALGSGSFTISNLQGDRLLDVSKRYLPGHRSKYFIRDPHGHIMLVLKKQTATMHGSWTVMRGDNVKAFRVAKTSVYQFQPEFEVKLFANTSSTPDFVIRGDIVQDKYTIFDAGKPIAEIKKEMNGEIAHYKVTVIPEMDHAFIAALAVIMDQVKRDGMQAQQIIRKLKQVAFAVVPMVIGMQVDF